MIIDAHVHIYPEAIAEKAAQAIGEFYDIKMQGGGSLSTLLSEYGQTVNRFLVHSVATTPAQVGAVTSFIASCVRQHPDKLIGFSTLHPDSHDLGEQINNMLANNIKGVKMHPDFQRFHLDGKRAMAIWEALEGRLPVLLHVGDYRTEYSKPARLLNVIKRFPKLKIIAAHFGGWSEWENAVKILAGQDIYVDTSSTQFMCGPEKVRRFIDDYGPERVLFGSDWPMWSPVEELKKLEKVFRSDKEREMVLHGNIEKLLMV
ncbi:MAG: amidohydrolase family protein [Clostridia bacterium]|nr:amidohydrolase family protein [Clostridia bacterium]